MIPLNNFSSWGQSCFELPSQEGLEGNLARKKPLPIIPKGSLAYVVLEKKQRSIQLTQV